MHNSYHVSSSRLPMSFAQIFENISIKNYMLDRSFACDSSTAPSCLLKCLLIVYPPYVQAETEFSDQICRVVLLI